MQQDKSFSGVNTHHEFMFIMHQDDMYGHFMKCIKYDRQTRFFKHSQYLNGKLHISNTCETENEVETCSCCNKPFHVRGVISRYQLYALLPKENVYVPVDTWYHEHMKSQMMELLYIFRMTGATSVRLTVEKKEDNEHSTSLSASGECIPIMSDILSAEVGIDNKTVTHNGNLIDLEATYMTCEDGFKAYERYDDFLSDEKIHYLNQRQDWRDIIDQRLTCMAKQLKFTFNVTNTMHVERTFFSKFQSIGLELSHKEQETGVFCIQGSVIF